MSRLLQGQGGKKVRWQGLSASCTCQLLLYVRAEGCCNMPLAQLINWHSYAKMAQDEPSYRLRGCRTANYTKALGMPCLALWRSRCLVVLGHSSTPLQGVSTTWMLTARLHRQDYTCIPQGLTCAAGGS